MWFNRKKIKNLDEEIIELSPESEEYDPVELEKKNLEILNSLNEFYEQLLFLSRLFNACGFLSLSIALISAFIWWPLTIIFVAIGIWCFWFARSKKSLSDCAPSFIRFTMFWDEEIRKANTIPGYEISPPKGEDFI